MSTSSKGIIVWHAVAALLLCLLLNFRILNGDLQRLGRTKQARFT